MGRYFNPNRRNIKDLTLFVVLRFYRMQSRTTVATRCDWMHFLNIRVLGPLEGLA